MSYSTWHNYGYGIYTSDLIIDSVERIEELMSHAPEYRKEIHEWFEDCDNTAPTVDDYLDFDQDYNNGIAAILQEVIKEATGIEFTACDNFDCMRYLIYIYMPSYSWYMTERDRTVTQEELDEVLKKYVSIVTDSKIEIDYQEVENGG